MNFIKFFPLVIAITSGGAIIMNRQLSRNSEEVEMEVMSTGYEDLEKGWGVNKEDSSPKQRVMSFWKKDQKSFKRNKEARVETHKDIYIFDLCNEWVKFAGSGERIEQEAQRQEEKDNITDGYGYTWKDICSIVKDESNGIGWVNFVTKVMKKSGLVQVKDRCCDNEKVCEKDEKWDNGEWLQRCFDIERKKVNLKKDSSKQEVCRSIWGEKTSTNSSPNNNCIDSEIGKRLSEKIRISRNSNGLGDGKDNQYWCNNGKNGYLKNNGEKQITEECKKTLKEKIEKFIKDNSENKNVEEINNSCKELFSSKLVEVKCKDGWIFRSSKSS